MIENKQSFRVPRSRAIETHQKMREEILQALEPVLFGSTGASYEIRTKFERAFAKEVQQTFAVGVHSGTMGLFLALRACEVEAGDEVITTANSDISTTGAISQCGAIPVLCDVLETDYTIDTDQVENLITSKTRAILPVDLHGHPADVKKLRSLADKYGLKIVEDAALASGAMDYGKPVGVFADVAVFSFAPIKPLGSIANGAIVVTSDEEIHQHLRLLVGYGHDSDFSNRAYGHQNYIEEGYNVPLDGMESAILMVKLPHLKEWTSRRRAIVQAYHEGLADTTITLPSFRPESLPTFRSYAIRVDNQQATHRHLRNAGIEAVLHYTPPIHHYTIYSDGLRNSENLSTTEHLAKQVVNLPVTPELTKEDTDYVLDILRDLLK